MSGLGFGVSAAAVAAALAAVASTMFSFWRDRRRRPEPPPSRAYTVETKDGSVRVVTEGSRVVAITGIEQIPPKELARTFEELAKRSDSEVPDAVARAIDQAESDQQSAVGSESG